MLSLSLLAVNAFLFLLLLLLLCLLFFLLAGLLLFSPSLDKLPSFPSVESLARDRGGIHSCTHSQNVPCACMRVPCRRTCTSMLAGRVIWIRDAGGGVSNWMMEARYFFQRGKVKGVDGSSVCFRYIGVCVARFFI